MLKIYISSQIFKHKHNLEPRSAEMRNNILQI